MMIEHPESMEEIDAEIERERRADRRFGLLAIMGATIVLWAIIAFIWEHTHHG